MHLPQSGYEPLTECALKKIQQHSEALPRRILPRLNSFRGISCSPMPSFSTHCSAAAIGREPEPKPTETSAACVARTACTRPAREVHACTFLETCLLLWAPCVMRLACSSGRTHTGKKTDGRPLHIWHVVDVRARLPFVRQCYTRKYICLERGEVIHAKR